MYLYFSLLFIVLDPKKKWGRGINKFLASKRGGGGGLLVRGLIRGGIGLLERGIVRGGINRGFTVRRVSMDSEVTDNRTGGCVLQSESGAVFEIRRSRIQVQL